MEGMLSSTKQTSSEPSQLPTDPDQKNRFNGVVQSDAGPINVKNGIATVDGQMYFVSDDGRLVVDKNSHIIAVIQDGKVVEVTPEIVDQLTQEGLVE